MAKGARAGSPSPSRILPDEIIWEILVLLPPKSLLRCRVVCHAWRHATSTRDFLLVHHGRQPTLPLLHDNSGESLDIIPFDHRTADQLRPIVRLANADFFPQASCDGLLILSIKRYLCICNPATRQYALLQQLSGFRFLGMYLHSPTGEYRLLLYWAQKLRYENILPHSQDGSYVFSLGSGQPPMHIGGLDAGKLIFKPSVMSRGNLYWHLNQGESASNMIMVFDTTTETFRYRRAPVVAAFGRTDLLEMDGMLSMSNYNDASTTIDIWVAQDNESEVWTVKYRVELPVAELVLKSGKFNNHCCAVVASLDGGVLMVDNFGEWLFQVDMDGKLVASFNCEDLAYSQLRLKQSLVSHTFFPTLERYVVNALPFI